MTALFVLLAACSSPQPVVAPSASVSAPPTAPRASTLRVLVTGAAGRAVAGARVCAASARVEERCVDASDSGTAEMTVPPGTYFVRAGGPSGGRGWSEERRVTDLARGDATLWIELTEMHRIAGTVRDASGAPVGGAEACARPAFDEPSTCGKSGSDGAYTIDVKAGVYRVEVSGPPGGRLVGQWAVDRVFLEEANVYDARTADVSGVDVILAPGVALRGTVRFDGKPVEEAQVCLRTLAEPLPWDCVRTDRDGRYAALRVPGRYWVWVVPPDDFPAVAVWHDGALDGFDASPFDLEADATLDVALRAGPALRTISGTVRAASGEPVAGALVCVDTPFTTGRICRETGGTGRYVIATRPETYVVNVIPPAHSGYIAEYYSRKRTWNDADTVTLGPSDVALDLVLRPGTLVLGLVRTASGIPVAGATLNFSDDRGVLAAVDTDVAGRFEAAVLPGRYRVQVFPPRVGELVGQDLEIDVPRVDALEIVLDSVAIP